MRRRRTRPIRVGHHGVGVECGGDHGAFGELLLGQGDLSALDVRDDDPGDGDHDEHRGNEQREDTGFEAVGTADEGATPTQTPAGAP